jgi:hypothetical protein
METNFFSEKETKLFDHGDPLFNHSVSFQVSTLNLSYLVEPKVIFACQLTLSTKLCCSELLMLMHMIIDQWMWFVGRACFQVQISCVVSDIALICSTTG